MLIKDKQIPTIILRNKETSVHLNPTTERHVIGVKGRRPFKESKVFLLGRLAAIDRRWGLRTRKARAYMQRRISEIIYRWDTEVPTIGPPFMNGIRRRLARRQLVIYSGELKTSGITIFVF